MMEFNDIIRNATSLPTAEIAADVNEALAANGCVVLTAPPGAGKSTLLPLTVMAGFLPSDGKILMLEPRRLAARQVAERMADMLSERTGGSVGYRVRFENRVSESTRIEVITEGILTRMLIADPLLEGVSVVIFDEFHERSINSDLAFALTRQCQQILRPDLKIVIMSATIDTSSICTSLNAPLIECQGKMFPVETRYATTDISPADIPTAVASAINKAHSQHEGDILAFLPGQADIAQCERLLADKLSPTAVFPLYGNLSPEQQRRAVAPSGKGERKIVLATPVAETSITIEGVRIVVDSGYCRQLVYNPRSGLSHLETVRISLDMATQRSGRAGRVAPGVCYRLWTKASEHRMNERRRPEISDADLAPTLLDIAAFGESDAEALPWLTTPQPSAVAQARKLLATLDAVDSQNRITSLGRQMSKLPCHPHISKMMVRAESPVQKSLACDIAAILEEKDPLTDDTSADLCLRISLLRAARRQHRLGRWSRIAQIAEEYRNMIKATECNDDICPEDAGCLVATAYPERVAKAIDSIGHFRLASGVNVQIDNGSNLASYDWLAVAALNASEKCGRVFLAAPLRPEDIETRQRERIFWDSRNGGVAMLRERTIGVLTVDSQPLHNADKSAVVSTVCEAVQKEGLGLLDWSDDVARLQKRVDAVAEWHPEMALPDLSTEHVLSTASEWLPFYIEQNGKVLTTAAELKKINLHDALWALIPYDMQQEVDRLAPSHITVPSGSRIRVDYRKAAEAPVLSVRLQECFGMLHTPCVDGGKRTVLMELLSPGFKPVQLTQDMDSFWSNAYFEVRKELKRRYPKHYWPENPLDAEAVRGVKRK